MEKNKNINSSFIGIYHIKSFIDDEPDRFVTEVNGDIYAEDDNCDSFLIAKTKYLYIDIESALNEGYKPDYIFDLRIQTNYYIEALYDVNSFEINEDAIEILGANLCNMNLFIVDNIEILPNFRGNGLANKLIEEAVRLFSAQADIVALQCMPLQFKYIDTSPKYLKLRTEHKPTEWEINMNLNELDSHEDSAYKSLSSCYEKMGFRFIGDDNVMAKLRYNETLV